jgi:hypothetical protein
MRYSTEQLREMARITLADVAAGGDRGTQLVLMLAMHMRMSPDLVLEQIKRLRDAV